MSRRTHWRRPRRRRKNQSTARANAQMGKDEADNATWRPPRPIRRRRLTRDLKSEKWNCPLRHPPPAGRPRRTQADAMSAGRRRPASRTGHGCHALLWCWGRGAGDHGAGDRRPGADGVAPRCLSATPPVGAAARRQHQPSAGGDRCRWLLPGAGPSATAALASVRRSPTPRGWHQTSGAAGTAADVAGGGLSAWWNFLMLNRSIHT